MDNDSILDRVKALPADPAQESSGPCDPIRAGTLCRDVYECSEYERAAYALAAVSRALAQLPPHVTGIPGHSTLLRQIGQKSDQMTDQLSARVHSRLCAIFSDNSRPGECGSSEAAYISDLYNPNPSRPTF